MVVVAISLLDAPIFTCFYCIYIYIARESLFQASENGICEQYWYGEHIYIYLVDHVRLSYNPYFSACFFSRNSIFLSQQIIRNNISTYFFGKENGSFRGTIKKGGHVITEYYYCGWSKLHTRDYSLYPQLTIAVGFHVETLTQFIENMYNICISK